MSIQRYGPRGGDILTAQSTGQYVTYADHLAEVEAAIEQEDRIIPIIRRNEREDGMLNERQRIVDAVEALRELRPYDAYVSLISRDEVLAAIKGDSA